MSDRRFSTYTLGLKMRSREKWDSSISVIPDGFVRLNRFDKPLVPARISLIIGGSNSPPIWRDAVGGAIIFDKHGELLGHVEVDSDDDGAFSLGWKGKLIAWKVK